MGASAYERRTSAGKGRACLVAAAVMIAASGCGAATPHAFEPFEGDTARLSFVDLDGGSRTLAELAGKVVLLDFWATWCKPCERSMPVYAAWQRELGPRGLVVVAASVDEADAPVAEFAAERMDGLTVWRDPDGRSASMLGLPTMPTAFILDRSGHFRFRHVGFESEDAPAMRATIEAVLSEASP